MGGMVLDPGFAGGTVSSVFAECVFNIIFFITSRTI